MDVQGPAVDEDGVGQAGVLGAAAQHQAGVLHRGGEDERADGRVEVLRRLQTEERKQLVIARAHTHPEHGMVIRTIMCSWQPS